MRTGRPKLPETDRRSELLRIRVTRAELRRLAAKAKASGKEVSTWAREELLAIAQMKKGEGP
jgi:hypothetical protein